MDFAPIRQYQNAHIAKGLYYETNDAIPESKKEIARINMKRMGFVLEPRIMENAAVLGYRITGAEHLWIPRVLSSVFWVAGGVFLLLIAKKLLSPGSALFSVCFYLFLPYGILASRSFQPDPLMVMMMLSSIYLIMKYNDNPSYTNLTTAAIAASIAVLVKPYCIFMIFLSFVLLAALQDGFWRSIFCRRTIIFSIITLAPGLSHYLSGLLSSEGFLGEHARSSFLPHLIVSPPFWKGWLEMIGKVIGYLAFLIAAMGLVRTKYARPRALLLGLWTGYVLFGLSATYQMHTHSYYHLPLIPVAALSIGSLGDTLAHRHNFFTSLWLKKLASAMLLLLIIAGVAMGVSGLPVKKILSVHKSGIKLLADFTGLQPEFRKFLKDDFDRRVRIAEEIGTIVGHSTRTVFLTPDYGRVLAYHGELAGMPWPRKQSLYGRAMKGVRVPDIENDFASDHITMLYQGKFIRYTPDYFIITEFSEFERQADLKNYLNANFPLLVQTDDYLIYDLREMSGQRHQEKLISFN